RPHRSAREPALHTRVPRPSAALARRRGGRGPAAPLRGDPAAGVRGRALPGDAVRRDARLLTPRRSAAPCPPPPPPPPRPCPAGRRRWPARVAVLRFRARPRLGPPLPDLGRVVTSEAAAYLSVLRPTGAEYVVLESVRLGG